MAFREPKKSTKNQGNYPETVATFSVSQSKPSKYGEGSFCVLTLKEKDHTKESEPLFKANLIVNQFGAFRGLSLEQLQELSSTLIEYLAYLGGTSQETKAPSKSTTPVRSINPPKIQEVKEDDDDEYNGYF